MGLNLKSLAIGAVLWLSAAALAFGQGVQSGLIRGTVTSADGLSLPGATVSIKSPALQGEQSMTTESDGGYLFRGLPPGSYTLTFALSGMGSVERPADVPLGGVAEVNVTLQLATVAVSVEVTAQVPTVLTVPTVGANFKHDEIDALATPRTLSGIANLSPGVTENGPTSGPTAGQAPIVINGAFSFDNIFMVNGVDVNDNIFAFPQNLFVEDAIQETQVLTSGISAEFGRFSGGVVNAITKSGGNSFSGSYRLNLTNDDWSTRTPFEAANNVTRISNVNPSHEATFGGPIVKDRLWFFLAGRYQNAETSNTLPVTGIQYVTGDNNKRGEVKLTGTVVNGQTLQVSFLNDPRTVTHQANFTSSLATVDPFALSDKDRPNHLFALNYKGVAKEKMFLEAQYSEMKFSTNLGGGTSRALVDSPIINFAFTQQYNAPVFDVTDPDGRNNRQLTGSASYFTGRHALKVGYEWFRSQHTGGNSQSATGYVFYTDYVANAAGSPIFDTAGRLQPVFIPGATQIFSYISTPGAVLNIDNNSLYAQDHWRVNGRLSLDLGVRFEKVKSVATGDIVGVDTHRTVPRLAAAFDPKGNGRYVFHVTYAHYSGRYDDALIGANSPVGNPSEIDGIYVGPAGKGRDFAAGFNPANYSFANVFASFPTANVKFDNNLSSPLTKEFTLSAGGAPTAHAFGQVTYVWRSMSDIIEDFISLDNGTTHVVQPGVDLTVTNRVFKNSDVPTRQYQGLLFQGRYDIRRNWTMNGNWTVQLKNEGNYEGEASNQILTSLIGDYPQIFNATQQFPTGRLQNFQRNKVDIWSVYNMTWGRWGDASLSGLWRYNSARVYSLKANVSGGVTSAQAAKLASLGYPDAPQSQSVYYSTPGSESFAGYAVFDMSFNYNIPIYKSARPWVKLDVFNLFNNQKMINWDTTIKQDKSTPADALGISTGYVKGPLFGQATSNTSFPTPFSGQSGGRTFRIALGVRF